MTVLLLSRRVALTLGALALASPAFAQDYPSHNVTIVVPFAPGASTDAIARLVAEEMRGAMNATFVIENRPGANGMIGAVAVARAPADGYTLFYTTGGTHSAVPHMRKKVDYDALGDFTPIAQISTGQLVLSVNPALGVKSITDLVKLAKEKPGRLSYATNNASSLLSGEWFKALAGLDIVGVPYKSAGDAFNDLVAGRVDLLFADQFNGLPLIKAGRLIGLAVTGTTRSTMLPDLPTMQEAGFKDFAVINWSGLFGPKNLPGPIVDKLNGAIATIMKNPEFRAKFDRFGYDPVDSDPQKFDAFVREQYAIWGRAILTAKIPKE